MSTIIPTGACTEHKSRKKGPCPSCQGCRHCEPLQGCERCDHHIKPRVKRSNICTVVPPSTPFKKQKKGLRSPENCKRGHFYDDTSYHLPDENCYDLPPNIAKLTKLCESLELDNRFVDFVQTHTYDDEKAQRIAETIGEAIWKLICPPDNYNLKKANLFSQQSPVSKKCDRLDIFLATDLLE